MNDKMRNELDLIEQKLYLETKVFGLDGIEDEDYFLNTVRQNLLENLSLDECKEIIWMNVSKYNVASLRCDNNTLVDKIKDALKITVLNF